MATLSPPFAELPTIKPFDEGWYQGHRAGMGPVGDVERALKRATRKRDGVLSLLLPQRRSFLDGFIRRLELELERRGREHEREFRAVEPSSTARTAEPTVRLETSELTSSTANEGASD